MSRHAAKSSLVNTRDVVMHKMRKKVWERALGSRALELYEPRVRVKVELLMSKIVAAEGSPINVTKYFMYFSFDVMADTQLTGFSKDFCMLESTSYHPAIQGIHRTMSFIGILSTVPWLIYMVGSIPGLTTYNLFSRWCRDEVNEKRKFGHFETLVMDTVKEPQDIMSWLLKAPPSKRAVEEDARLLLIAGSDTSAGVLTNALYLLASNPHCYRKLQAKVQEQFPGGISQWTYEGAKAIPYIDHVIHETMRLRPIVPGGMPRTVPPQGILIDGQFIPGGTIATVPTYTIQRDERYWEDPLVFKPERWEGSIQGSGSHSLVAKEANANHG
ncbi:hypothetical protein MKX07_004490 [Trichoderma sp. CBMAI-0711]|nr:hypothetical protein MKX07_004490 [Trichoderma sp. CBMAI-0711]